MDFNNSQQAASQQILELMIKILTSNAKNSVAWKKSKKKYSRER
jgi:hypothetical protein